MNEPLTLTNSANQFSAWFEELEAFDGLSAMDHLFNRLDGAYPHKWRSNFPNADAIDNWKTSWAEAFEEEGIRPADIRGGLRACRTKYDWPPSCAEFIKACRPSVDPLIAYYEAVNGLQARAKGETGEWSHPAIFWATLNIAGDLLNQPFSKMKTQWERALEVQMAKHEWEEVPKSMLALAAPGKTLLSRESADKMVKEIGAAGVTKKMDAPTDCKRWARNVLERAKRKNHGLQDWVIADAKKALGIGQ
ncbi:hypothetical protein GN109_05820 [Collimonas pratensis]|uniref:replication protein P n=1 Tax=Collimonas pratensis TaxID=279113 RepID=UPI00143D7638|nr:replication protein P [Collimonas pratensis]NKI68931.1 hypothetical protein [Collimonas pratensis]